MTPYGGGTAILKKGYPAEASPPRVKAVIRRGSPGCVKTRLVVGAVGSARARQTCSNLKIMLSHLQRPLTLVRLIPKGLALSQIG
jgi:hypothetical protein